MLLMRKVNILTPGVSEFLSWTQLYNVWFAFFNLLPIPPMDGSRLLNEFLPPSAAYKYNSIVGRYGFYILIALVASGLIGYIVAPFAAAYMSFVFKVLGIFL